MMGRGVSIPKFGKFTFTSPYVILDVKLLVNFVIYTFKLCENLIKSWVLAKIIYLIIYKNQ